MPTPAHKLTLAVVAALSVAGCMWSDETPSYRSQAPITAAPNEPGNEEEPVPEDPALEEPGSEDPTGEDPDGEIPPPPDDDTGANGSAYYLLATDNQGNVNLLTSDAEGAAFEFASHVRVPNTAGKVSEPAAINAPHPLLGDVIWRPDPNRSVTPSAFFVIPEGLIDTGGRAIGGGYGVVDINLETAQPALSVHSLSSQLGNGARLSRLSGVVAELLEDGSSNHLWLLNEGPRFSADATQAERQAARAPDSVFRVNWDHADTEDSDGPQGLVDDRFGDTQEITVGHGKKMAAVAAIDADQNYVFVHNTPAHTISIVDNVPTSPTFQQVVRTLDLGVDRQPEALVFSPASGNVYVAIGGDPAVSLGIIDASLRPSAMTLRFVPAGTGAGQIPVAASLALDSSGRWLFAAGYQPSGNDRVGQGFLSVIDTALADALALVKPLGDMKPGKIDVAAATVDNDISALRVFIASDKGGAAEDIIAVIDFDPEAGNAIASTALNIGPAKGRRATALSTDHRWIFFAVNGSCDASAPADGEGSGSDPDPTDGNGTETGSGPDGDGEGGLDGGGSDGGSTDPGAGGANPSGGGDGGGVDVGVDIGLSSVFALVDVGVDIGLDPNTDLGVDTGSEPGTDGSPTDGTGSTDPNGSDGGDVPEAPNNTNGGSDNGSSAGSDGGAGGTPDRVEGTSAATCASIIPVDVTTLEVSPPLHTVGKTVRGMAVHVTGDPAAEPPTDDGGTNAPPDDGSTDTPSDDGGTDTPPDGGTDTPPDDGSTDTPPDDGGTDTPPDDGAAGGDVDVGVDIGL